MLKSIYFSLNKIISELMSILPLILIKKMNNQIENHIKKYFSLKFKKVLFF